MTDMVKADLDRLQALGNKLAGQAADIGAIDYAVVVSMSDGPIQQAFEQTKNTILASYRFMSGQIRQMSDAAKSGVKTYEAMESANVEQFHKYTNGQ